jgi:hypothetical protein
MTRIATPSKFFLSKKNKKKNIFFSFPEKGFKSASDYHTDNLSRCYDLNKVDSISVEG